MAAVPKGISSPPSTTTDTTTTHTPPSTSSTNSTSKPNRLQIQTEVKSANPTTGSVHPPPSIANPTPPASPGRARAKTMGASDPRAPRDGGNITPPSTPTKVSHSKSSSTSSYQSFASTSTLSSLRRGDSISSTTSRKRGGSMEDPEKPGSTTLKTFPHHLTDYEIGDKKKPLGSGLWSDVYRAKPCLPKPQTSSIPEVAPAMTPPITPSNSRTDFLPLLPATYAIKVPASRSAKAVLSSEALVLSYLSRFPDSANYLVPFYGQDTRTQALVLKALDTTLDKWVEDKLNSLPEADRAASLISIFPTLALDLIKGLEWIQSKGCTHADVKPSNILLSTTTHPLPKAIYSDFSSATLETLPTEDKPPAPLGGGTWDFLDPTLVAKSTTTAVPSKESDLWSLAITLLYVIIGCSPFDCAESNQYRRREFVKQGVPLSYAYYGDDAIRNKARLESCGKALGFDFLTWFGKVLKKETGKRCDIKEWREELESGLARGAGKL